MSTLLPLLLLAFLPQSDTSNQLSDASIAKLSKFTDHMIEQAGDMTKAASAAFAKELVCEMAGKIVEAAVNAGFETQKNLVTSDVFEAEIEDGAVKIQMQPKKASAYVSQRMSNAYRNAFKSTMLKKKVKASASKAALKAASKYNWEYELDGTGEINKTPGEQITSRLHRPVSAKGKAKKGNDTCNKKLCKDDGLAMCINHGNFMDYFFLIFGIACNCYPVLIGYPGPGGFKVNASSDMEDCLTDFKNSKAIATLKCADSLTEAARGIIELKLSPYLCDYKLCDLSCLKDTLFFRDFFKTAISSNAELCVKAIDPVGDGDCLTSVMDEFADCILEAVDISGSTCPP